MTDMKEVERFGCAIYEIAEKLKVTPDIMLMALAGLLGSVCTEANNIKAARDVAVSLVDSDVASGMKLDRERMQ